MGGLGFSLRWFRYVEEIESLNLWSLNIQKKLFSNKIVHARPHGVAQETKEDLTYVYYLDSLPLELPTLISIPMIQLLFIFFYFYYIFICSKSKTIQIAGDALHSIFVELFAFGNSPNFNEYHRWEFSRLRINI